MENEPAAKEMTTQKTVIEQSESEKAKNAMWGSGICSVILGICAFAIHRWLSGRIEKIVFGITVLLVILCLLVALSSFFDWKTAKKIEKLEAEAREEEKEFSEIDFSKKALRAEKMFKMNQKELMRYYDMNLAQTKFLSGLGIIMIIFGILIIVVSVVVYVYMDADKIILLTGNISGILIDFVGAVFIRMYTQNVEAAVRFHAKFAESNNLLLANSIANKIEDEKLREETLSEIARDIIRCNKEE